jgi:Tfp pilus assembly protein PilX
VNGCPSVAGNRTDETRAIEVAEAGLEPGDPIARAANPSAPSSSNAAA